MPSSKDTSKSGNDSSIVFKLFRDLESEELERASRVKIVLFNDHLFKT